MKMFDIKLDLALANDELVTEGLRNMLRNLVIGLGTISPMAGNA